MSRNFGLAKTAKHAKNTEGERRPALPQARSPPWPTVLGAPGGLGEINLYPSGYPQIFRKTQK
jgi:hypothetical protein